MVNVISLHVPKCAGSGLRKTFERACRANHLLDDYDEYKAEITSDTKLMTYIKNVVADDLAFYEKWESTSC